MLENIPDTFLNTTNREFRVLVAIENKMKFHEWVPVEEIASFTEYEIRDTEHILSSLGKKKLIQKKAITYESYRINFEAYYILALKAFVERGSISAIGDLVGIGKESRVYSASSGLTGREIIIKFHTEGRPSFKNVRIKRGHIEDRKHLSWMYASRLAAKREYDVLKILYPSVSVPEPLDHNRNAIVMSVMKGHALVHTRVDDPEWYLDEILAQVKKAAQLGIIHCDLSEFNVFVNPHGCEIFDWPQYITVIHPNTKEFLYRDIGNVLTYFKKRYRISRDIDEVCNSILGSCQKK